MYVCMYSISLVSSVVKLNTSVTEKVKNSMKSTVLKLMNIVFYQSPQPSVAIPNTSYSDKSLKA